MRELHKSYGDQAVLAGINFEIDSGEVFALLGPNGAGKTTTVEILEGYRDPTAGEVGVLGFDPWTHPIEPRERTGVVLQECGFPNHLRVRELLDAWRGYYREPRPTAELLELVELTAERSRLVRRLSGGQRRRLDFALALAGDPDVIFLDEPTTGFDPEARRRCWAAIENLSTLGKCIVLTTHYLDEAERLADRIAILADGRIRAMGTAVELAHLARAPTLIRLRLPASVPLDSELVLDGAWFCDNGTLTVRTHHPSAVLQELIHAFDELPALVVTPPNLEANYLTLVADTEPLPA
ncbi:MAG TPA: ABC transporter ATP-binding protein [Jiangellaceae bacterium]|nr:ABC transporter ATP-binding protein [Jiangellaceae bacterium]